MKKLRYDQRWQSIWLNGKTSALENQKLWLQQKFQIISPIWKKRSNGVDRHSKTYHKSPNIAIIKNDQILEINFYDDSVPACHRFSPVIKNEYQSDIHARENFKTKNFLVESWILNIKKYARINLHVFFIFLCYW